MMHLMIDDHFKMALCQAFDLCNAIVACYGTSIVIYTVCTQCSKLS